MADREIVQKLIYRLGQSQDGRMPPALDVHYADVDERTTDDLLAWCRKFSSLVNYYADSAEEPAGDWTPLISDVGGSLGQYLESEAGVVPPHFALVLAFLELYRRPQAVANQITGRHLDFYYRDVLRLRKRGPVPDAAHLVLELKKGAAPVVIDPKQLFSAGKDATGTELLYAPVREAVINHSAVASLRSIYLDRSGRGSVRFAPVADSADGLGEKIGGAEPKWRAFGYPELPHAAIGFAVASPVLRMREGERSGTLRLRLAGSDGARLDAGSLATAFSLFLTGEKSWMEPDSVSAALSADGVLSVRFTLGTGAQPVVDYDPVIHGFAFAATAPVAQVVLREGAKVGYLDLESARVMTVGVSVEVSGVTSLTLESDAGGLDPRKAFLPFGPQAAAGSRFMVSYPEALSKKLTELKLAIAWKDAPTSLAAQYEGYGVGSVSNGSFTATARFTDGGGAEFTEPRVPLFDAKNAAAPREFVFQAGKAPIARTPGAAQTIRALDVAGSRWALQQARRFVLIQPIRASYLRPAPPARPGFITLTLDRGFLHAEYRRKYVENVLEYSKSSDPPPLPVLNEPYTPAVQAISLSYKAHSDDVPVSSGDLDDFANADAQFFLLAPFGPMREHGYQRRKFAFLTDPDVGLLPRFPYAGELVVGLAGLLPGDSVSLLFQVAAGSADPDLQREPLRWSVLCDNYWKPLGPDELTLDTTNGLLTSGLVQIVIPPEATIVNTILPAGPVWIRVAVPNEVRSVGQLIAVAANALEVRFADHGNDPMHLTHALPAGSITKPRNGIAAVKAVAQPFSSFGGSTAEQDPAFNTRIAERLRHKNRCITAWDYERVVLEAFPEVHLVKCIPHAKDGSWMAPGHVLLVVVPDIRNRNAVDPLQPRVDADTISRIAAHVRDRAGAQIQLGVKNPRYQKVRLDFKVSFRTGYEFNHYREELQSAIIRALSPWAFEAQREIAFGGAVYRSVLLDLIEELPYVDYVTDFHMYTFAGDATERTDTNEARPATPDTILVSDGSHTIERVT